MSLIGRILAAKTWQERVAIAERKQLGTRFDSFFEQADRAMQFAKDGHTENAQHEVITLGAAIAETCHKRDFQVLRDMANALKNRNRSRPHYVLMTLCTMASMFPPGWEKTFGKHRGRRLPAFPKPPRDKSVNLRTNDIIKNLRREDPKFDDDKIDTYRRQIQRYARRLGIPLDGSPFKPTTKMRHYPRKKSG